MTTVDLSEPFDVLVAGGGNAALCAAITAARGGARVCVRWEGRAAVLSRRQYAPHPQPALRPRRQRADHELSLTRKEEFLDDLMRVTGGQTDDRLARMTVARSTELIGWLERAGRALPAAAWRHAQPRQDQRLLPRRRPRRAQHALPPGRGARRRGRLRRSRNRADDRRRLLRLRPGRARRPPGIGARQGASSPPAVASRPMSNG